MKLLYSFALVCAASLHALAVGPAFSKSPRDFPAIGLSFPALEHASGDPLELPAASAFIVTEDGKRRMQDRYDVSDLWYCDTILARWRDEDGSRLSIARLSSRLPDDPEGTLKSRTAYYDAAIPISPKALPALRDAAYMSLPFETGSWEKPRFAQRRNLKELFIIPSTNAFQLAYAFRPRSDRKGGAPWYVAALEISPDADADNATDAFDRWLDSVSECVPPSSRSSSPSADLSENELLSRDFRRNIENYSEWAFTSADGCLVADALSSFPGRASFIASLTNNLPRFRAAYAERCPTALSDDVHPAAVRVFADRDSYLSYVGEDAAWTAAVWSPVRRELALYLPEKGTDELLRTIWHEAFHQYLDYACATVPCSPWFNEGHAQLFQHAVFEKPRGSSTAARDRPWTIRFGYDPEDMDFIRSNAAKLADLIPAVLNMDYDAFYASDQQNARTRAQLQRTYYRLAWSIAYFLEVGAPEVRFRPFANVRRDYLKAIIKTRRMEDATRSVFTEELLQAFVREWTRFFT